NVLRQTSAQLEEKRCALLVQWFGAGVFAELVTDQVDLAVVDVALDAGVIVLPEYLQAVGGLTRQRPLAAAARLREELLRAGFVQIDARRVLGRIEGVEAADVVHLIDGAICPAAVGTRHERRRLVVAIVARRFAPATTTTRWAEAVGIQLQPPEAASGVRSLLLEPLVVGEFIDKRLFCPRRQATRLAPNFPRHVEHARCGERARVGPIDAVVEPLLDVILVDEILLARRHHGLWHYEARALPLDTSIDHPPQDGRILGHQLFAELRVGIRDHGPE